MSTDLITRERKIIEYNQAVSFDYMPLYPILQQKVVDNIEYTKYIFNKKDLVNLDDDFADVMNPQDTEIKKIKALESTFNFNNFVKFAEYSESQQQNNYDEQYILNESVKKAFQIFDKKMLLGDVKAGNSGLIANNINTITETSEQIDSISKMLQIVNELKSKIEQYTSADAANIQFMFAGAALKAYGRSEITGNASTAFNILRTDTNFIEVNSSLYNINSIIAFVPSACVLHRGILPQIYNMGVDDRAMERWAHIAYGSNSVKVGIKGAAIVQPVTIKA